MIGGCILAMAGYIMLLVAKQPLVRYGGTFLVASGVFVGSPMVSHIPLIPIWLTRLGHGLAL